MALTFSHHAARAGLRSAAERTLGSAYAWSGFLVMWAFWICLVIFLANPTRIAKFWPLPTIDQGSGLGLNSAMSALIDLGLIALFGLQHSLMARPWFKAWWAASIPPAFERCTFVHMANLALFAVILFWQPIPTEIWTVPAGWARNLAWALFAVGWLILFAGAWSFGILDLLGIDQMRRWCRNQTAAGPRLKTGLLYRWLRHPMYVGVLLGVWATPAMTLGHLLLASGFTLYVLIAMRYEERDLAHRFGQRYASWRSTAATR